MRENFKHKKEDDWLGRQPASASAQHPTGVAVAAMTVAHLLFKKVGGNMFRAKIVVYKGISLVFTFKVNQSQDKKLKVLTTFFFIP